MRFFVLEVTKTPKGPQIIVSRNHPNLVKRLFEMEVPEVLESVVEIRTVAREAGDRSKISVWSKDDKVDCVGACVGMRGSRVKNVVRELQGEKIDIVRWSENVSEYVKAALSPAECASLRIIDIAEKKIEVLVEDDQLSLAIGKNGQNVRLASKLTGWSIDIRSKTELLKPRPALLNKLTALASVTPQIEAALKSAAIEDVERLVKSSPEELAAIEGIDETIAAALSAEAVEFMASLASEVVEPKADDSGMASEPSPEAQTVSGGPAAAPKKKRSSKKAKTNEVPDGSEAMSELDMIQSVKANLLSKEGPQEKEADPGAAPAENA
jgi:N utilization substance protein A